MRYGVDCVTDKEGEGVMNVQRVEGGGMREGQREGGRGRH